MVSFLLAVDDALGCADKCMFDGKSELLVMKDCVQKGELVREEMKVIMERMTG